MSSITSSGISRFCALAAAVGLGVVGVAVSSDDPVDAAVSGGRIRFDETESDRTIDTRTGRGVAESGPVTSIEIGSGVLQVFVLSGESAGSAVIHPCDEPAPTDRASFRLTPEVRSQYASVFASRAQCLTSTLPVDVLVSRSGTVSDAPSADGEQYVALPGPERLSIDEVEAGSITRILRPAALSADASQAVIGITAIVSRDDGYAVASGCDGPTPFGADVNIGRGRAERVVAIEIEPGEDICVFTNAATTLVTDLLGEIRANGPSPSALPPNVSFVDSQVKAPGLRPIVPERVLDTRVGIGTDTTTRIPANTVFRLGFGDIVSSLTTAITMNVTVARAPERGFLTVWPCDGGPPIASNVNFAPGGAIPNLVVTKLSDEQQVCITADQDVHVIVDVNGTYETDGGLDASPIDPERILDTRFAVGIAQRGRVAGGRRIELQVTGGEVPDDAGAATLNVTATGSDDTGYVTVFPCDAGIPATSNVNFRPREATPNLVTTELSPDGTICLFVSETVHLIADIAAWYGVAGSTGLIDLAPIRVLDTREPVGVDSARRIRPGERVVLDFDRAPVVATDGEGVVINITAARSAADGYVTVWPCDQEPPVVSNLNLRTDRSVANLSTVALSDEGTICLESSATTHLVADVSGYLTSVPVDGLAVTLD